MDKQEILNNLNKTDLSLTVNRMPSEKGILKIIEFLKDVESASNRFKNPSQIISNYTHFACFDLAMLIKSVYEFDHSVKLVKLTSKAPFFSMFQSIIQHFVIYYHGFYYDINGKHTKTEMKNFCIREFYWQGVALKTIAEDELSTNFNIFQTTAEPSVEFCLSKIKKTSKPLIPTPDTTIKL